MNPQEIEPILLALPESWQPWARLLLEVSALASLLAAALKAAGVRNWLTVLLDAVGTNTAPVKSLRTKQLEGQVAGLTGEVAALSADKARRTAKTMPPLPLLCIASLMALGACSWREKPVEWPTALLRCAPPGDAMLGTVYRALGSSERVTGAMRDEVVRLAREHGPAVVACAMREAIAIAASEVIPKNAAFRNNPYGSPVADNACELAREMRVPIHVCE